ncbi:hypothetical protein BTHE_2007 [Bifidobacterium thermophilum]|nr:hypothetical protein BTHE_2007 [Bifidobacterium thermophilum]
MEDIRIDASDCGGCADFGRSLQDVAHRNPELRVVLPVAENSGGETAHAYAHTAVIVGCWRPAAASGGERGTLHDTPLRLSLPRV